jgi:hypothetical protein
VKHKPGTGQIGSFHTTVETDDAIAMAMQVAPEHYNFDLDVEFHDSAQKPPLKLIPCTICKRPMVVNTFYVLAWAKCLGSGCGGEAREAGSVAVAQAGRTDPKTAVNLSECLINPSFDAQHHRCPVHPDDETHEMKLKSVSHNDYYGPGRWAQAKDGTYYWDQTAKGETVMLQCGKCWATASFSTTAQHEFKPVNAPRPGKHVNGWADQLGVEDESEPPSTDHVALRNMGFEDV